MLIEDRVATGWDQRRVRDAKLHRRRPVVGEEPTAEVHLLGGWVIEFNKVKLRRSAGGQRFVDEHRRESGVGIVRPG